MRNALLAAATALALLSGCMGEDPAKEQAEPTRLQSVGPADFSETLGGIDGLVLDSSMLPVADARVTVHDAAEGGATTHEATTAADGRFAFGLLEPGTMGVSAEAPGFGRATQIVQVTAGASTRVELALTEVAGQHPYLQVVVQAGLINCSFAVVAVSGVCVPSLTAPVFGPYNVELKYEVPAGHKAIVSEADWANSAQAMRNWFFKIPDLSSTYADGEWMGDAMGTAGLRKEFFPDEVPYSFAKLNGDAVRVPPSEENFTFEAIMYYDGSYQQEINGTAAPVCSQNPVIGYCTGAGLAIQMRYDQYVTVFVHQAPASLAAYSALRDE